MESTIERNYVVQSTNLITQKVVVGQARFTLEDATAIVETANNTKDAWFYELAECSGDNQSQS